VYYRNFIDRHTSLLLVVVVVVVVEYPQRLMWLPLPPPRRKAMSIWTTHILLLIMHNEYAITTVQKINRGAGSRPGNSKAQRKRKK